MKGEMRIFGFDESVSVDDVRHDVSKAGDSLAKKVDVGPIRRMSNELYTVWVRCPLAAAIHISPESKFKIGWTVARVELLKARPTQCYKCWQIGHSKSAFKSTESCDSRPAVQTHLANVTFICNFSLFFV